MAAKDRRSRDVGKEVPDAVGYREMDVLPLSGASLSRRAPNMADTASVPPAA